MSAEELRELADKLVDPSDTLFKFHMDQAAAYLRACADALDAGPVGWISPSNPWKDGSDPRQLVQDYEASGGYGYSADTALSRGWTALYPLAMPAQLALRLPEPMTGDEIEGICWTEMDRRLLSFARAIESETLRRVKEVNNAAPTPPVQQDDEALKVLRDVMTWIDNWHCQFKDDENWPETEDRARALLAKRGAA